MDDKQDKQCNAVAALQMFQLFLIFKKYYIKHDDYIKIVFKVAVW